VIVWRARKKRDRELVSFKGEGYGEWESKTQVRGEGGMARFYSTRFSQALQVA